MKTSQELFSLKDRVAIVTGGRGKYGSSMCWGLAEAGATVIVASRNGEKCDEFAAALREAGHNAYGLPLDLADDASILNCVNEVLKRSGKIDVLVNNAVDFNRMYQFKTATRAQLTDAYDVNINGTIILSQRVVEVMKKQGGGSIIHVSSIRGTDCPHFPFYPETWGDQNLNYSTEKWAMVGLAKFMAGRFGKDNIRVNCLCPGGNDPDLLTNPDKVDFVKTYIEHCPLGRWANKEDIKGPVVFLASDASAYVTGLTLLMDGGWTIW